MMDIQKDKLSLLSQRQIEKPGPIIGTDQKTTTVHEKRAAERCLRVEETRKRTFCQIQGSGGFRCFRYGCPSNYKKKRKNWLSETVSF